MRVKFTKRIARGIGLCNRDAFLFRWVDIPIDPYPELVVVENDWEGVIDKVVIWQGNNRPQREIECRTASDGRSIHQKERTDADMAECVKGYVEAGWMEEGADENLD